MKTLFETEICSRCHGSGKHSFCERYRDICFKCAGNKSVFTKRGQIAREFLVKLLSKPANELKPGDRIKASGITHGGGMYTYTATVISVENSSPSHGSSLKNGIMVPYTREMVSIRHISSKFGENGVSCAKDQMFLIRNDPKHAEKLQQALEYQATLTKTGTVRKTSKTKETK